MFLACDAKNIAREARDKAALAAGTLAAGHGKTA
jgi:hypothetical protein